jgi:4a-hydroxytetrahydrobiopterin dehydratase
MNKKVCSLSQKSCVPCQGGVPSLDANVAQTLLSELENGWDINDKGHLLKSYNFKDFMSAIGCANKIAEIAEKEAHHPDLTIAWGRCDVEIWTHKIEGLTESDFILAAKIDGILSR